MGNERLRAAIAQAGLDADQLATLVEVDVKSVQRWIAGAAVPYTRHRTRVAKALRRPEQELWPEVATRLSGEDAREEIIGAFAKAGDPRAPSWLELLKHATARIDLLDYSLIDLLDTPGTVDLLAAKGARGCQVRILIAATQSDPVWEADWELAPDWEWDRHLGHPDREHEAMEVGDSVARGHSYIEERLLEKPGVQAREFAAQRFNTILRFDDEMLLTLHLWGVRNSLAPLLHLRRTTEAGLFDQFVAHYEALWQPASPLEPQAEQEQPEAANEADFPHFLQPLTLEEFELELAHLRARYEDEIADARSSYEEDHDLLDERRRLGRHLDHRADPTSGQ